MYVLVSSLVHIERFLGLVSEYRHAYQIHAMWLACDYHVTLCYSQLLLHMRAVNALPCQNDALSRQSYYVTVFDKTQHMGSTHYSHNACFSISGQKMSKSSFCHIHVKEPFY